MATQAATPRGAVVFFVLFATVFIATAWYRPPPSLDVLCTYLPAWSLGQNGTINFDGYLDFGKCFTVVEGSARSDRFPGAILAAVPAYAIFALVGGSAVPVVGPSAVAAALIAAGSVTVMHRTLLRVTTPGLALGGAVVFGLGTSTWSVSSDALWTHTVTQFGLCLVLYALASQRSSWALVGMLVAAASRPHVASIALVLAAGLVLQGGRRRELAALIAGTALGWSVVLAWTATTLGGATLLPGTYEGRGTNAVAAVQGGSAATTDWLMDLLVNVDGFLVSPQRGLLVLTPVIVIALIQLPRAWRWAPNWCKSAAVAAIVYSAIQAYGNIFTGGGSFYSYRLAIEAMTLITPLIVIASGIAAARGRTWCTLLWLAMVYGFTVQSLGAIWYEQIPNYIGPWRTYQPLQIAEANPGAAVLSVLFAIAVTTLIGALVRSDASEPTSLAAAFRRHARNAGLRADPADAPDPSQRLAPRALEVDST